jgi:hypothetical protein
MMLLANIQTISRISMTINWTTLTILLQQMIQVKA